MRAWACLRFLCVVLKEKWSTHEFDGNIVFMLVLFRFASCIFRWHQQQTEDTTQGTLYLANLLLMRHPIIALPDTAKHEWKLSKLKSTMHQEDPPISDTILLVGQLVVNAARYSINLIEKRISIFFSLTIRYERVSITAENVVMQLIDLFPFLGFVNRAVCGQHKHTGQTTWRYNQF